MPPSPSLSSSTLREAQTPLPPSPRLPPYAETDNRSRSKSVGTVEQERGRSRQPSPIIWRSGSEAPSPSPLREKGLDAVLPAPSLSSGSTRPASLTQVPVPKLEGRIERPSTPAIEQGAALRPMSFNGPELIGSRLAHGPKMARLMRLLGLQTHQQTAAELASVRDNLGPKIDQLLSQKLGFTPCLDQLEIEFVGRPEVRPYLCGGSSMLSPKGIAKWLLGRYITTHYSTLMPSQSKDAQPTLGHRGRLLVALPNMWWLSRAQREYQLVQALTIASIHQNAPATPAFLDFFGSAEDFAPARDGLGALMHGLSDVVAHALVPEANRPKSWWRPHTWFWSRSLTQRFHHGWLRFVIPEMLRPARLGRKLRKEFALRFDAQPDLIGRSLRTPGATVGLTAKPDAKGVPLNSVGEFTYAQLEQDAATWERLNPHRGAIHYVQPQSNLRHT